MIEMSLREWLIIFGLVIIIAILVDGLRRVRANRNATHRFSIDDEFNTTIDHDIFSTSAELPNGGARVVRQESIFTATDDENFDRNSDQLDVGDYSLRNDLLEQEQTKFTENLLPEEQADIKFTTMKQSGLESQLSFETTTESEMKLATMQQQDDLQQPLLQQREFEQKNDMFMNHQEQGSEFNETYFNPNHDGSIGLEPELEPLPVEELITVFLLAKKGSQFSGSDLLQTFQKVGLYSGDMKIFHRFEQANGQGEKLFSIANVVEPGYLSPEDMDDNFSTPGLCLFLSLPGPARSTVAFTAMIETAHQLMEGLQGELRDENHSVLTMQAVEHYRQRVAEFERKRFYSNRVAVS